MRALEKNGSLVFHHKSSSIQMAGLALLGLGILTVALVFLIYTIDKTMGWSYPLYAIILIGLFNLSIFGFMGYLGGAIVITAFNGFCFEEQYTFNRDKIRFVRKHRKRVDRGDYSTNDFEIILYDNKMIEDYRTGELSRIKITSRQGQEHDLHFAASNGFEDIATIADQLHKYTGLPTKQAPLQEPD